MENDEDLMKVCILYVCWKESRILDYENLRVKEVDIDDITKNSRPVKNKYSLRLKAVHYYMWVEEHYVQDWTVEHYMEVRKKFESELRTLINSDLIKVEKIYPAYLKKEGAYSFQYFLTRKGIEFLKQHEELLESLKEADVLEGESAR
jgi:hypothetical protein